MAADDVGQTALPGKVLGPVTEYAPGPGTHIHEGSVVSSLLGHVSVLGVPRPPSNPGPSLGPAKRLNKITGNAGLGAGAAGPAALATISVHRHGGRKRDILPDVGHVVLARVLRLMPRQAIVVNQQVESTVLQTEWQGVIRVQDVRATEKDKVKIHESFKPGDIVKARVVCTKSALRAFFPGSGPLDNKQR